MQSVPFLTHSKQEYTILFQITKYKFLLIFQYFLAILTFFPAQTLNLQYFPASRRPCPKASHKRASYLQFPRRAAGFGQKTAGFLLVYHSHKNAPQEHFQQKRTPEKDPTSYRSLFHDRASCVVLRPYALPVQLTQPRHPHGTWKVLLSAALFPT